MSTFPWRNILSGALFGASLTAAGMYSPSTIISQMQLTNFHMMKGFLAGSASSALAILLAQSLNLAKCQPRTPSTIRVPFLPQSVYQANIVGGTLLGVGMALTGACPGTVLPQVSTGISTAPFVLLGTVLGGILFSYLKPSLLSLQTGKEITQDQKMALQKPTVWQQFNISKEMGLLVYEAICIAMILGAVVLAPSNIPSLINPLVGGLLIGTSQFLGLWLTGSTLAISTAYEQLGDLFLFYTNPSTKPQPNIGGIAFASGTLLGSFLLARIIGVPAPEAIAVGKLRAVMGGVLLILGARLAGGCTSGHGISGMSMLSLASFWTVGGMFGGGIGVGLLMKLVRL